MAPSLQTYYKLNYVDRRIDNPEQRMCEDIPLLADGLADLLREWCNASVDAIFYAFVLRSYSRTNKYTLAILGYVFGAGIVTTLLSPNFGKLYKIQSSNEGIILSPPLPPPGFPPPPLLKTQHLHLKNGCHSTFDQELPTTWTILQSCMLNATTDTPSRCNLIL